MESDFRKKLWIGFGIIVGSVMIASVALYVFSGDIIAQANAIAAKKAVIVDQNQALANLASLKAAAPAAATYQAAMDKLLPDQFGLVDFQEWLSEQGGKYGVTANFSLQGNPPSPPTGTLGTAPFSLTAQGTSVADLTAFLEDIEAQAPGYLLSINSFDLMNGSNPTLTAQGILFFK